jgi:hypothetical protein
MDDQSTDRESGSGMIRPSKRFRMSLKAMLLAVTLFCALCAYYRVHGDNALRAERAELRVQVDDLKNELRQECWEGPVDPELDLFVREATDRIAEINEQLRGKRAAKAKASGLPSLTTQISSRLANYDRVLELRKRAGQEKN